MSNIESKLQESGSAGSQRISLRPPTWFKTHRADYQTIKDTPKQTCWVQSKIDFRRASASGFHGTCRSTGPNLPQAANQHWHVKPVADSSLFGERGHAAPPASPNGRQGNARQAESAAAFKAGEGD